MCRRRHGRVVRRPVDLVIPPERPLIKRPCRAQNRRTRGPARVASMRGRLPAPSRNCRFRAARATAAADQIAGLAPLEQSEPGQRVVICIGSRGIAVTQRTNQQCREGAKLHGSVRRRMADFGRRAPFQSSAGSSPTRIVAGLPLRGGERNLWHGTFFRASRHLSPHRLAHCWTGRRAIIGAARARYIGTTCGRRVGRYAVRRKVHLRVRRSRPPHGRAGAGRCDCRGPPGRSRLPAPGQRRGGDAGRLPLRRPALRVARGCQRVDRRAGLAGCAPRGRRRARNDPPAHRGAAVLHSRQRLRDRR